MEQKILLLWWVEIKKGLTYEKMSLYIRDSKTISIVLLLLTLIRYISASQQIFTYSKSTIEALEKGVKYAQS